MKTCTYSNADWMNLVGNHPLSPIALRSPIWIGMCARSSRLALGGVCSGEFGLKDAPGATGPSAGMNGSLAGGVERSPGAEASEGLLEAGGDAGSVVGLMLSPMSAGARGESSSTWLTGLLDDKRPDRNVRFDGPANDNADDRVIGCNRGF